ncbi:hypothetical protein [Nonomuraea wenchangensis]|uniref:hypothetical protein n=1 Tax=Nonomuraea wenchangensis TaxID=568860 RepID=UPI00332F920F
MSAARSSSSADRFKQAATSRQRDEAGQAPARGSTAKRTKPVRITVDLDPADYRTMRRLVDQLAELTDIPPLPHSEMWRALLRRAAADPRLLADIAEQIKADRD